MAIIAHPNRILVLPPHTSRRAIILDAQIHAPTVSIGRATTAVDKVRKQEARGNALLRRTKYLWLRNEST